jgi:hypothetical protein
VVVLDAFSSSPALAHSGSHNSQVDTACSVISETASNCLPRHLLLQVSDNEVSVYWFLAKINTPTVKINLQEKFVFFFFIHKGRIKINVDIIHEGAKKFYKYKTNN